MFHELLFTTEGEILTGFLIYVSSTSLVNMVGIVLHRAPTFSRNIFPNISDNSPPPPDSFPELKNTNHKG